MRSVVFLVFLGLGLVLAPSEATSQGRDPREPRGGAAAEPTLVVRFKPVDDWLANLEGLAAPLRPKPEAAKNPSPRRPAALQAVLQSRLGPKGLQGLDTQRPLGLYATLRADIAASPVVVLVPITGEDAFLDLLARAKLLVKKGDNGIHNLTVPDAPFPVYFRFAHGHAYFTWKDPAPLAQDQLLEPDRVMRGQGENSLLVASLRIDQLPEALKKQALAAMKQNIAQTQKQTSGQTEAAFANLLGEEFLRFTQMGFEQGRDAVFRLDDQWRLEGSLAAQLKSPLAAGFVALGQAKSRFAGLASDDAFFALTMTLPASAQIPKALGLAFDDMVKEWADKEKDADQRKNLTRFFEILRPTVTTPDIDLAMVIRLAPKSQYYTFILGQSCRSRLNEPGNGAAVERAFRDLVGKLPEAQRRLVHFDAEKADAISIHRIDRELLQGKASRSRPSRSRLNEVDNGDLEKYLGDNPAYFAATPDALFVIGGENGLATLKQALALPPGPCPAFRLRFPLAFLALKGHYGLVVQGGETLKVRFEGLSILGQILALGLHDSLESEERARKDAADPAVAALKKLGATVVRDKRPGQPVVRVSLAGAKVTDASLAYLKELPQLETLTISSAQVTDAGLVQLQALKQLRSLQISSQTKLTDAGLANLKGLARLQTLDLSFHKSITDAGLAHLAGLREIESLNLSFTPIKGVGLAHLKGLAKLSKLNLLASKVDDEGLAALQAFPQLQELDLSQTSITDAGMAHLKGLTKLEKLRLVRTPITDSGLAFLEGLDRLQALDLLDTKIGDAGLTHLKQLRRLRKLNLENTKITDAGLVNLQALDQLQELNLAKTKVGDAGLTNLKSLDQLQTLDLDRTRITDAGLVHLQGLRNLQRLTLNDTEITDASLVSLKVLDQLKYLYLNHTQMTDRGVAELRKARPRAYIGASGILQILDQNPKERFLRGHAGPVTAVAFSADGEKLFSAGLDGSVIEWDVDTAEVNVTHAVKAGIPSLAIAGNGETLAMGGTEAVLWGRKDIHHLKGHGVVTAVALTKDGKLLASGSDDQTIKLWDVPAATERMTLKGHTLRITALAFTADGKLLASASADGTLKLWEVTTGMEQATLRGHTGEVTSVAFTADGQTLASGGSDAAIKLWDVAGKKERATFKGHKGAVTSVALTADGKVLASGSEDKTAKLWDLATAKERATFKHTGPVTAVALTPDGMMLASGCRDRTLRLGNCGDGSARARVSGHATPDAALDAFVQALLELDAAAYKRALAKNPESRKHFHDVARGRRRDDPKKPAALADQEALDLIRSQLFAGQTLRYPPRFKEPDLAAIVCLSTGTSLFSDDRAHKFLFAKVNDQWYLVGHGWWTASPLPALPPRVGEGTGGGASNGKPVIPPEAKITPFDPGGGALSLTPEEAQARLAKMKIKPTVDALGRITAIKKYFLTLDEWRAVSPLLSPDFTDKNLTINGHLLADADMQPLAELKTLEKLEILGPTQVTDKGMAHLSRLTNLKELSIHCPYATAAGVEALRNLQQLEKLEIQARITDAGLAPLWQLTKLKVLVLANNDIRGPGLEQLKYLQELEVLDLSNNLLTSSGLDSLPQLPKLKRLVASNNQLGDAGLRPLGKLTTITALILTNNGITDAGLEPLATLSNLEQLELRQNQITGPGLAHLKGIVKLSVLNLRDNPLTDVAVDHLCGMTGLGKPRPFGSSVEITTTAGMSKAALDKFKKAFPKAQVNQE